MSRIHQAMERDADNIAATAAAPAGTVLFPMERRERRIHPRTPAAPRVEAPPAEPAVEDGLLGRIHPAMAEKVVGDPAMPTGSREQYRKIAAILHDAQATDGLKVVMVASAAAGEGKTLTACNLAMTLSESYRRRVLLIDGDLRRPALHRVFRIASAAGLGEGLQSADARLVLREVSPRLSVLPAGRPSADPMASLTSPRMRQLIAEARDAFDFIIIDTPPLVLLPDAHLLGSLVDGTLLVIRANGTPHRLVKQAVAALGPYRLLGAVLNQAQSAAHRYGSDDDYYGDASGAGA